MAQASAEKLEQTGPAEKESGLSATEQLARTLEPPLPKGKEQSHLSRVPDHQGGESKVSEREIRARAWRGKGGLHSEERQIQSRRGRANEKSLPRRCRRKHEQVSGHKSSLGGSAEFWFHSKSGQT